MFKAMRFFDDERGNPVYRVKKTLDIKDKNGNNLPFDDDCNIMYINGEYRGDDPLGRLMHDFSTPNAEEMYYEKLAEKIRFFKQDEKGVQMASKLVEEYGDERAAEAYKDGLEKGAHKKAVENAKNFLKMNVNSIEQIAQGTGLSVEEVQKLADEI